MLLVTPTLSPFISLPVGNISLFYSVREQPVYLPTMNIPAAFDSAVQYAYANPGTVTIATGSVAAMAKLN